MRPGWLDTLRARGYLLIGGVPLDADNHSLRAFGAELGQPSLRALAQPAPFESVKIITGFTPGGTSDTICRRVAAKLAPGYGKSVLVEQIASHSDAEVVVVGAGWRARVACSQATSLGRESSVVALMAES